MIFPGDPARESCSGSFLGDLPRRSPSESPFSGTPFGDPPRRLPSGTSPGIFLGDLPRGSFSGIFLGNLPRGSVPGSHHPRRLPSETPLGDSPRRPPSETPLGGCQRTVGSSFGNSPRTPSSQSAFGKTVGKRFRRSTTGNCLWTLYQFTEKRALPRENMLFLKGTCSSSGKPVLAPTTSIQTFSWERSTTPSAQCTNAERSTIAPRNR